MKDCWKKKEKTQKTVKSIGIAGAIRGSGATHLSVALANYAASGLGEKTACLELGGHGELAHWKAVNKKGYFTDAKIHYYPDFKKEQIPVLINCAYEKIIMDFGDAYISCQGELLRCDRKIVLLNLNPWQEFTAKRMIERIQSGEWGNAVPVYASVNAVKAIKKSIEREYRISIAEIPLIPNPACVSQEAFSCMNFLSGHDAKYYKKKKL